MQKIASLRALLLRQCRRQKTLQQAESLVINDYTHCLHSSESYNKGVTKKESKADDRNGSCSNALWVVWVYFPDLGWGGQSCEESEVPVLTFQERFPWEFFSQCILGLCKINIFFPLKEIETFYEKIYLSSFFFALHFIQLSCHHMWHNFTLW